MSKKISVQAKFRKKHNIDVSLLTAMTHDHQVSY